MTDYTAAPATALLATHCCCCGRPLLDAESVTRGVGPVCAEKYGFLVEIPADARAEANAIVHRIAASPQAATVVEDIARLEALGLVKLAGILRDRLADPSILIKDENGYSVIKTPYSATFVAAIKRVPPAGRKFIPETKSWGVLPEFKRQAFAALIEAFAGECCVGPKGMFIVPEKLPVAQVQSATVSAPPAREPAPKAPKAKKTHEEPPAECIREDGSVDLALWGDIEAKRLAAQAKPAPKLNISGNFTRPEGSYSRDASLRYAAASR